MASETNLKDLASNPVFRAVSAGLYSSGRFPVEVVIQTPHPAGSGALVVRTAEELADYLADPLAFVAARNDVTPAEYIDWMTQEHCVHCAAMTREGKPCQNVVRGGNLVDAKTWVVMQGSKCRVHEHEG